MNFISKISFLSLASILPLLAGCGDQSGEFEYVAIGASDAVGIGATPLTNGYVYRIQDGLKADGRDVGLLNLGIPDASINQIRDAEVRVAADEEPELITIFAGANDIVDGGTEENYRNNINGMLDELSSKTEALIVIGTIPDLTQLPRFKDRPDSDVTAARVGSFNSIIREEAARFGVLVVELADEPILESEVAEDGFHPNSSGYERIANDFLGVIRPNLPPDQD